MIYFESDWIDHKPGEQQSYQPGELEARLEEHRLIQQGFAEHPGALTRRLQELTQDGSLDRVLAEDDPRNL